MQSVLIVDDSRLQRKILAASLKRWGYEVWEADSGEAALEICTKSQPDLILSDWMMPGMDGLEFCRAFRALPSTNYAYFILLTSKSDKSAVAQGLDAGADDFLNKPFVADELRARITAGERIVLMQKQLTDQNRMIADTLAELQGLYQSLDNDLQEAKKLQQSLVREREKEFHSGHLALMLRSSGHVGGDLVGFFQVNERHLGLFALDVSGHGISSALMTARLAGYLSAAAPSQNVALRLCDDGTYVLRPPGEVVEDLNSLILDEMETEHYFTMILADVSLDTGQVRLAQAGHPHPVVQRKDGSVEHTGTGGLPVGLIPNATFEDFVLELDPGDRLLLMSDGVVECPDPNENLLDEEGVTRMLQDLKDVTGTELLEAIQWRLSDYAEGGDFPDDVSIVSFEFKGAMTG
ncbi:PP2C family protein-serine/threonine phosphatase [Primorskyibacter sp. S187A]|uniref:PP2C family protein-serine/threonine phosphatase n=1 Tax=Primorskyibacter sp. S187A TaxID=3415130 RepID=UPI003C7E5355